VLTAAEVDKISGYQTLMMETDMVPETSVMINQLTWLMAHYINMNHLLDTGPKSRLA
jgi:hypothetical protein